ncbi:lysophospholipid acyltransferase family protein [Microvirga subterranea]|uniref:1-acyl-sn-glycerol-3-phosphate acyltransferase n=1 Tax=Microvirga subterranea TaxID=186651 RepID=A0A370HKP0_9HYPH|nr:lysophospholipid acyltransferase family protein [Microvirga subterranea]RDI59142.1 1-acyl-sn-glycerol-3-phosphate acyltransferase [Microvirga subterranea]
MTGSSYVNAGALVQRAAPEAAGQQRSKTAYPARPVGPWQWARSKLFDLLLAFWTALFGLAVPILWLFGSPEVPIRLATRIWVRGVLFGLKHVVGLNYMERGREHVPNEPCLIVGNHQSTWETLASLVLFPDVAIVAKQELLSIPVFGWYLRRSPMIIIDREAGTKALRDMILQSQAALDKGRSVLVFPEGTRRPVDQRVEFKRGAEFLYTKLGVPTLTMAVNSGRFWSPGATSKGNGTITVIYGSPIAPGLSGSEFTRKAESTLEADKNSIPH